MNKKAAVIGAGISGLYASLLLEKNGYSVDLYERDCRIGGRMTSDIKSGFILDRGFHVLQTGYPKASTVFDYESMGCKPFEPGALVIKPGGSKSKIWRFADPFRRPISGMIGAFNLFTSPINLARVGLMRIKLSRLKDENLFIRESQSTYDYLRSKGFSKSFIEKFFTPLFGGIFLESDLRTDSRMFNFVFKNMSRGDMVLPRDGISACCNQLYERLQNTTLRLNAKVDVKSDVQLVFEGTALNYEVIIRAFAPSNAKLSRDVWTVYFSAPNSPLKGKYIMLNSCVKSSDQLISHLAVPSDIQPSYSPDSKSLIAVTVVGEDAKKHGLSDKNSVEKAVLEELSGWFPEHISSWETLAVQHVVAALPELSGKHYDELSSTNDSRYCGDYNYHGSVEGALISAERAVNNFLQNGA